MIKMCKKTKIIKVKWVDSSTYSQWYKKEDIEEAIVTNEPIIESIGYLIFENKEKILLASNNDDEESFSAITSIPKCSIMETKNVIIPLDRKKKS